MNKLLIRISLLGLFALLFFGFEYLVDDDSDSDIASSPRAVQYREKISELALIGGGKALDACIASFKHTVLLVCRFRSTDFSIIQTSLSKNNWQQITESNPNIHTFKNSNDIITLEQTGGIYFISMRAVK